MTTKEAFHHLIHVKNIHRKLGITAQKAAIWRMRLKSGDLSEELMADALKTVGYTIQVERQWAAPQKD